MTRRAIMGWVVVLYFIEGLPFGVFADALPVYFRMQGLSLRDIGVMSLLQLPWSLKVLWSPWVDRLGTPRRWIGGGLVVLTASMAALALHDLDHGGTGLRLAAILGMLALASATQDVAIDGYFVRLMRPGEEGMGNGLRVGAYRVALIVGGGGTVVLAGLLPWYVIFGLVAALFGVSSLVTPNFPHVPRAPQQPLGPWLHNLVRWVTRPGSAGVFAFILLYKLGDASMGAMVKPFWVDRGMLPAEIGLVSTTFGVGFAIVGALAGGWYTSRVGIFRALWVLGLFQAFSNLGYAAVAYTEAPRLALYAASVFESFTQGLGTSAQLALLTRICDREHAATQYAALSAMFGLTRALAGAASGLGAEQMGFGHFFALTFLLSFPAYAFLPWVRIRLRVP